MSNDFLINTRNETALVYNDVSVNENMHLATAFKILRRPGNDLMEHLSLDQYRFFRRTVIQIVLATDMAGHSELLQASPLPLPLSLCQPLFHFCHKEGPNMWIVHNGIHTQLQRRVQPWLWALLQAYTLLHTDAQHVGSKGMLFL